MNSDEISSRRSRWRIVKSSVRLLPQKSELRVENLRLLSAELIELASKHTASTLTVSLAGGSSVGKSTQVASLLQSNLGDNLAILDLDSFQDWHQSPTLHPIYRWDDPDRFRLDHFVLELEKLKNQVAIEYPIYDFRSRRIVGFRRVLPRQIILVEGLYAAHPKVSPLIDFQIYVESCLANRLVRRVFRNTYERYQSRDQTRMVESFFGSVLPAHLEFVVPQRGTADRILTAPFDFREALARFPTKTVVLETVRERTQAWANAGGLQVNVSLGSSPSLLGDFEGGRYLEIPLSREMAHTILDTEPDSY